MTGRNIMQDVFEKQNDERLLISVQEACRLTGVCEKTMRNLLYENNLQVRIGRRVMVNRKKLESWIDQNTKTNL